MRAIWKAIEREIGTRKTGQMRARLYHRSKDQARRIYSAGRGPRHKCSHGDGLRLQQPKHGAVDGLQEPQPAIKYLRRVLEGSVEGAEDDRLFRKAVGAPPLGLGCGSLGIVCLVSMRQPDNPLREV